MTRRSPKEDPILAEIAEVELEPYKKILPPDLLAFFRRQGLALLSTHPPMKALLEQLREPPVVGKRGVLGAEDGSARGEDEDDNVEPPASGGGHGGG